MDLITHTATITKTQPIEPEEDREPWNYSYELGASNKRNRRRQEERGESEETRERKLRPDSTMHTVNDVRVIFIGSGYEGDVDKDDQHDSIGNAVVLVRMTKGMVCHCMFVGDCVQSLVLLPGESIHRFVSTIGASRTPSHFLHTTRGCYSFTVSGVYFTTYKPGSWTDPAENDRIVAILDDQGQLVENKRVVLIDRH